MIKRGGNGNGKGRKSGSDAYDSKRRGPGRPRNFFSLTAALRSRLQEVDPDDEKGRTFGDVIVQSVIDEAKRGHIRALIDIFDRIDGRPVARIEQNTFNSKERFDFSGLSDEQLNDLEKLVRVIQLPDEEEGAA